MLFAGIDVGSRIAKAVIIDKNELVSYGTRGTGVDSARTAMATIEDSLEGTGLSPRDMDYIVATGYGRVLVPFANEIVSEITCHARGMNWYFPSVRTIFDMGGEDSKVINCDGRGRVTRFAMNDKCAGGTGRFLELMADILEIPLEELGKVSLESDKPWVFCNQCVVYEKLEALSLLKRGIPKADIVAGIHQALVIRVIELAHRGTVIEGDVALAGGLTRNPGIVARINKELALESLLPSEPLIVGALGAALIAGEHVKTHN